MVSGLNVDAGEIVIAGTTNLPGSVLMKVSNMNKMRVRADVDETDVLLVREGQPAAIYLQADQLRPVAGRIDRVAPQGKAKKDEVVSFETLVAIEGGVVPASAADAAPVPARDDARPSRSRSAGPTTPSASRRRPSCTGGARTCPTLRPFASGRSGTPARRARNLARRSSATSSSSSSPRGASPGPGRSRRA